MNNEDVTIPSKIVKLMVNSEEEITIAAAWRLSKGFTHYDVIAKLDIPMEELLRIESNEDYTSKYFPALAEMYGCDINQISLADVDGTIEQVEDDE
ncbi:hypothetical protein [Ewingella americana]|uniref:XRE family transcriptional regulator n=1 Tax=Ewingella americana TaxID=41202 RepID=A0A502GCB5_9GAMM|nr:hypothetical protein [Ewingella americana]TPG59907.1 hypothetical protein EAH77_15180 [Ewingella americana]